MSIAHACVWLRSRLGFERARTRISAIRRGMLRATRQMTTWPRKFRRNIGGPFPFPVFEPTWGVETVGNKEGACPNPNSLKRDGEPLDGPDPQRAEIGAATDGELREKARSA